MFSTFFIYLRLRFKTPNESCLGQIKLKLSLNRLVYNSHSNLLMTTSYNNLLRQEFIYILPGDRLVADSAHLYHMTVPH